MAFTPSAIMALAVHCAPDVAPATLQLVIKDESDFNPYAIGVVGRALPRQPQSLDEALSVANQLAKEGASFSIGLGQINSQHFNPHNKEEVAQVFAPCRNLELSASILQDCYARALRVDAEPQGALRKALSCYYSGNFTRGFQPEPEFGGTSYVERVLARADLPAVPAPDSYTATPPVPAAPSVPPTYEPWDVLRQFPRFNPAPNPQAREPITPRKEVAPDVQAIDEVHP